ncbi:MAG: DUF3995 domain-containing protein [Blastocatellia bacterium]|nr:DUF3995 domain-containing protein [Blastocatellia bacterium]
MMQRLALLLGTAFTGLSLLHVFWAFGGKLMIGSAIPEAHGKPLFRPGMGITLVVALILAGFSAVALSLGYESQVPSVWFRSSRILGGLIGVVLLVRAVGEFRYVGFFKQVTGTSFAVYDTWLFSPFCLLSGCGFLLLVFQQSLWKQ